MGRTDLLASLQDNVATLRGDTEALSAAISSGVQIRGNYPSSESILDLLPERKDDEVLLEDVISADQIFALRAIALSNYDYYRPPEPILSINAAIAHFGSVKYAELLGNLAVKANLNSFFLGRAIAYTMQQQAIITADMSKCMVKMLAPNDDLSELAYIFSSIINVSPLMLATFKPLHYSALCMDALDNFDLFNGFYAKLTGLTLAESAEKVIESLGLPIFYKQCAKAYAPFSVQGLRYIEKAVKPEQKIAKAVYISNLLTHELCHFTGIQGLQSKLRTVSSATKIPNPILEELFSNVPESYIRHAKALGIRPLRLPEYLSWFAPIESSKIGGWESDLPSINERIAPFLYEIRQTIQKKGKERGCFAHAVHCTINALIRGLNFDRVILLKVVEHGQSLRFLLNSGVKLFEAQKITRSVSDPNAVSMPDLKAMLSKKAVFYGEPFFGDGWPFVAFPILFGGEVIAVFYADKIRRPNGDALDPQEEIACVALADEWHDTPPDLI